MRQKGCVRVSCWSLSPSRNRGGMNGKSKVGTEAREAMIRQKKVSHDSQGREWAAI